MSDPIRGAGVTTIRHNGTVEHTVNFTKLTSADMYNIWGKLPDVGTGFVKLEGQYVAFATPHETKFSALTEMLTLDGWTKAEKKAIHDEHTARTPVVKKVREVKVKINPDQAVIDQSLTGAGY